MLIQSNRFMSVANASSPASSTHPPAARPKNSFQWNASVERAASPQCVCRARRQSEEGAPALLPQLLHVRRRPAQVGARGLLSAACRHLAHAVLAAAPQRVAAAGAGFALPVEGVQQDSRQRCVPRGRRRRTATDGRRLRVVPCALRLASHSLRPIDSFPP